MASDATETKVKSLKSRRDTAVQGTNDSSIVSKCSMARTGYFQDDFLQHYVAKATRRAPLIHRGYYIRARIIDYLLKEFLNKSSSLRGKRQILSLGAGFDSSFFRLKSQALLDNVVFYEIDFPDVVKRKADIIRVNGSLMDLVDGAEDTETMNCPLVEISTVDYKLLGADLTQLNTLDSLLRFCRIDFGAPSLLLSECVLTYISSRCSSEIVKWVAETFSNAVFVMYEQIQPNDAFGLFMQAHFQTIGSPLKCINSFPTLKSQKERFLNLGWSHCETADMNDVYCRLIPKEEREFIEDLEVFDEHEGWHLKCSHYMILCAQNASHDNYLHFIESKDLPMMEKSLGNSQPSNCAMVIETNMPSQPVQRFGHSSVLTKQGLIITAGGFGEQDGKHQRITKIVVTDCHTLESVVVHPHTEDFEILRMYHSTNLLHDGSLIFFGGRTSPVQLCSTVMMLTVEQAGTMSNSEPGKKVNDFNKSPSIEFTIRNTQFFLRLREMHQYGVNAKPRWRHSSIIYSEKGKEKLIVYGGRTRKEFSLDDCHILDLNSGEWKQTVCGGESPGHRQSHTGSLWGQYLVVAGGLNHHLQPVSSIHLLDLQCFVWKKLQVVGLLHSRYSHSAHIVGDHLLLLGGVSIWLQPLPGIAVVNLRTGRSQEFPLPHQISNNIIMLYGHQSIQLSDERYAIIGGGGYCFSFGTHLNQSPFVINIQNFKLENI